MASLDQALPPGADWVSRKLADIERDIRELRAARGVRDTTITLEDATSGLPWLDVRNYDAQGDGRFAAGGMTAGSATLTATTSVFATSDVGKYVNVYGAGVAGAHLEATIAAFVSGTQVTLDTGASTTVAGASFIWGTDDTAAFNDWIVALEAGTVRYGFIPAGPGAYLVRSTLGLSGRHLRLVGTRYGRVSEGGGTTIYYCGTGPLFQLGTDNGQAYDDADYDGPQGLTLENLNLAGIGLARTTFSHALGSYATGTYAIRDWKGGDIVLRDMFIEQFQYGFWGVQSDLNNWQNVSVFYASVGLYLGPRSDQFTLIGGTFFSVDTAIKVDAVTDVHIQDVAFVVCGSATTPTVEITSSAWGRSTDRVTLDHCWFEYEGGYASVLAFVRVGGDAGTVQNKTVTIRDCAIPNNDPSKVDYFLVAGRVDYVSIENLSGPSMSTFDEKLVQFVGTTSPQVRLVGHYSADYLYDNSGSGSPVLYVTQLQAGELVDLSDGARRVVRTGGVSPSFTRDGRTTLVIENNNAGGNYLSVLGAADTTSALYFSSPTLEANGGLEHDDLNNTLGFVWSGATRAKLGAIGLELGEIGDPAAPAADKARLYVRDNGAGKTQFAIRFPSGAVQVLATQDIPWTGTGSPEGALTAPVGSLFLRTDGSAGTVLYLKETGTGNTGWVAYGAGGGAGIPATILDAKGDLIAATAADTASRLAVGANDTVLTADSTTGTGLKWATAAHPSLATHDALGLATDAELATHAAAADPHAGYVLESLYDAKGDLIAASADNTPAKLTAGANDTLLVADSSQSPGMRWANPYPPPGTLFVRKTADEPVTSSTAVQDDNELLLAVAANATYIIDAYLIVTGNAAGDLRLTFTSPAGSTLNWTPRTLRIAATTQTDSIKMINVTGTTEENAAAITSIATVATPLGILRTAGTAGTLQFRWAQDVSNATATSLLTDSWMRLVRVA